jgi:deazaflavin-dependent oxidoreductase (nitroreductase family)
MDEVVRRALAITPASPARARTIDITTIGAKTGTPRHIEIWFYRAAGRIYLSGLPSRPSWYVNLVANPRFTFHLKNGVTADLAATAVPITDEATRRKVFTEIVADLNQPQNPARIAQPTHVEDWIAGSRLAEVLFDD